MSAFDHCIQPLGDYPPWARGKKPNVRFQPPEDDQIVEMSSDHMFKSVIKIFGDLFNILPRLRSLEETRSDTQIELQQLISLLNMREPLPVIPPKRLQVRVAGAYNPRFFVLGQNMVRDIETMLRANGEDLHAKANILDFGCGCGRLTIPLSLQIPPAKISGTDIDKQAIHWMKRHYTSFRDLDVNRAKPPTKYSDEEFDFIYGISVFTHLPEKMQMSWLKEIARIMKPSGLGLFTFHGEKFAHALSDTAAEELAASGFHYSVGCDTDGLPGFYQTSYQTHDYVRRKWRRFFEVIEIRREAIGNNQDAVLVRKRAR